MTKSGRLLGHGLLCKKGLAYKLLLGFSASLIFFSCDSGSSTLSLEQEEVFCLEYGNFEDELNVYDITRVGDIHTSIAMRDGFFYVANGESHKIMELNSYGDLLNLYYNEDANPDPIFARTEVSGEGDASVTSTCKAIIYPFNSISAITVDSRKYLYVVEELPVEQQELDTDNGEILKHTVLRFNENGEYIDYLGREGPGGTPFPFVKNIYATSDNELVVVCTGNRGYEIYWFSSTGYSMYMIFISKENVPNPYAEDLTEKWVELGNIVPSYTDRKLYVKVDYFTQHIDETNHMQSGVDYVSTMLYDLDVDAGTYGRPLEVLPYNELINEGFSNGSYDIPYEFLGVTEDGWFFFIICTGNGFSLQMVQNNGQKIMTRNMNLNRGNSLFYTFCLSNSGILSALFIQQDKAHVDWWRTDELIQVVVKK